MPKTRDAFAFKKFYADFAQWQEKYQKAQREPSPPLPPSPRKEYGGYLACLAGDAEGWIDVISRYLRKYPLPPPKIFTPAELDHITLNVYPKIEVERGNQVLKRLERHIGRLKSYSQKILADVLAQGFNDALRTKGNRVNELISRYSCIAYFFEGFCATVQRLRNRANEKFQKLFRAEFGNRLRQARIAKNISIADMATMLDLTRAGYGNYELGKRDLPTPTIYLLAKILDVSLDWLFGLKD